MLMNLKCFYIIVYVLFFLGHPRFFNQLSSGLDIIGLAGEWLTSTANTNMWVRCLLIWTLLSVGSWWDDWGLLFVGHWKTPAASIIFWHSGSLVRFPTGHSSYRGRLYKMFFPLYELNIDTFWGRDTAVLYMGGSRAPGVVRLHIDLRSD